MAINPIFGSFYFEAMYIAKKEKNRCLYIYTYRSQEGNYQIRRLSPCFVLHQ